jgi:hypothetical protein
MSAGGGDGWETPLSKNANRRIEPYGVNLRCMIHDDMRISRNFKIRDWKALHFKEESDWVRAVRVFHDRIETRYLEHIESIINRSTSGFAVLTLECALIETLQQFRTGEGKTPKSKVGKYFVSFLTETSFGGHFDAPKAELFYTAIRCGLHHQSEAEGNSRIKRGGGRPLVAYTADGKGIVINVNEFHQLFKSVLAEYEDSIRDATKADVRDAFRKKMNYICRIEGKPEVEEAIASS